MHEGNITDQQTLPDAESAVSERFGIEHVVLVGDSGMITRPRQTLTEQGIESHRLKAVQVRALVIQATFNVMLKSKTAEIASELYPSERLIVCRNAASRPSAPANERACAGQRQSRQGEDDVRGAGNARNALAGKIGERREGHQQVQNGQALRA